MIAGIDHVVILVENLEQAVAEVTAAGFTVTPGGHHREGHTHNALVLFADGTYLELLGFTEPPAPDHYFRNRYQRGPGFADFALRSTDIDRDVATLTTSGLAFPTPTCLSRERPDGQVARWRMSLPQALQPGTAYPFLLEDLTDRQIRVPASSATTAHPNDAIGMAGISVAVEHLDDYHRVVQVMVQGTPPDSGRFHATRGVVQIPLTDDHLQMMAILQPTVDSVPQRHLECYGNCIYAISLRTRPNDPFALGTGDLIDLPALGRAKIYLQP